MSSATKREYLEILRKRYRRANRSERSQIIDELVANTQMHRKSAIRCLRKKSRRFSKSGRRRTYTMESVETLKRIWVASEYMCSKKIKRMLPVWIDRTPFRMTTLTRTQLLDMSPATMDRYLKPFRASERRRKNSGTRPGSRLFRKIIPIKTLDNIPQCAGYLEADTVAHCGGSMAGEFIWSLTVTDTFSGWTENRAVWGKSAQNVHAAIEDIENSLPFQIVSFNCDNGSEFLNHRLVEYFKNRGEDTKRKRFIMTRSRPYKKNDNAHVEQKNWTNVRKLFGYERLEHRELLSIMNEIYRVDSLFKNYWIPQFKLKSKVRIGTKIKKKYDDPTTPYQRLLDDSSVTEESKLRLRKIYNELNPFDLGKHKKELLTDFYHQKRKITLKPVGSSSLLKNYSGNLF